MPRYVAFLRGVTPMNAKMADLQRAFEAAGFGNVKTVLSSGNVVFDARSASAAALERKAEAAMEQTMGRSFGTIVRPVAALRKLFDADPYAAAGLAPHAKKVVTFLRAPPAAGLALPIERDGACIVAVDGHEAWSAYVPGGRGPVFMTLIEKTFGKDVTTRTLDTVARCAAA